MIIGLTPVNEEAMPFAECLWYSNNYCSIYEKKIEEACLEFNIPFLSIYNKMTKEDSWKRLISSDGIHLNSLGHKWIFNQVKEWDFLKDWSEIVEN